ncbi:MAG: trypsin-like peptidase domain-containing protein [Anderseniella sp.]|jgi:S1-C subfamily serine protease|nr:trypsin-like peptidase domain-containing protein [Anderseniella sp.]
MNPRQAVAVIVVCLLSSWPAPAVQAGETAALVKARASVVSVLPVWPGRPPNADEPEGSGVVIGDGTIVVTADHVLGPDGDQVKLVVRDSDGVIYPARIKVRSKASDIAVLSLETPLPPISLRGSDAGAPGLGEPVCAIGNAFGLGLSVTCGHVSAVNRAGVGFNAIEDFIQTDAAVNPGMSGGALVDREGRFAGLLSAIFTKQSDANIGVNFAIDAQLVEVVVEQTAEGAPFLPFKTGVLAQQVPASGEAGREGIRVARLVPGSAGEVAGLQPGDIIYGAGGRRIRKPQDWLSVMARVRRGQPVAVEAVRNGEALVIELRH